MEGSRKNRIGFIAGGRRSVISHSCVRTQSFRILPGRAFFEEGGDSVRAFPEDQ
jgi:hypothetical protein